MNALMVENVSVTRNPLWINLHHQLQHWLVQVVFVHPAAADTYMEWIPPYCH